MIVVIEGVAADIADRIRDMKDFGELPEDLTRFAQLHDHFDANTGWGDDIDALDPATWARVQAHVDYLLGGGE